MFQHKNCTRHHKPSRGYDNVELVIKKNGAFGIINLDLSSTDLMLNFFTVRSATLQPLLAQELKRRLATYSLQYFDIFSIEN